MLTVFLSPLAVPGDAGLIDLAQLSRLKLDYHAASKITKVIALITISAVARQTGISVATLRKWELRYGFPVPERSAGGQRHYRTQDVEALLEISRRLAAGERPGKAVRALPRVAGTESQEEPEGMVAEILGALQANDLGRFRQLLDTARHDAPAAVFIEALAAPLTYAVGIAWQEGSLSIYAEHYFSHCLRQVLASYGRPGLLEQSRPQVLLANFSGEHHTLGLAMLDAALQDAGVPSVMMEGDLPVAELVAAAVVYKVSALAISASVAFAPKALSVMVCNLRQQLPASIDLWLGGMGSRKLGCLPPGIQVMEKIEEAVVVSRSLQRYGRPAIIQEQRR